MYDPLPICVGCVHFDGESSPPACAAFPAGIPKAIWEGDVVHRVAYEGDQGLRYAPRCTQKTGYYL